MISGNIKSILCVLIVTIATACNDDIFVDRTDGPSVTKIELAGDGGRQAITFSRNGIQGISLDIDDYNITTYYDNDGNEIPKDSDINKVARINYTDSHSIFDVYISGNFITFKSTEQAYDHNRHNKLKLDYGHTVKYIDITILPGQPMILVGIEYDRSTDVTSTTHKDIRKTRYTWNDPNSTATTKVYVQPYLNQQCKALVSPEEPWAQYSSIDIQLPTYADGQWIDGSTHHLQTNRNYYYKIPRLDANLKIPIEIRANTTTDITCILTYATITTGGSMTFRNPVSGREHIVTFRCSVAEPLSYEINVNEIN